MYFDAPEEDQQEDADERYLARVRNNKDQSR
jgi:hypothetical protein